MDPAQITDPTLGRSRRFRPVKILMVMLIAAIAIMTGLTLNRYFAIEERLNYSISENVIWAAAQAEVELNLFLSTLTDAAQDDTPQMRKSLQERFDILWSRIGLYRSGTLRRSLGAYPELRDRIDALASDLKEIDAILAGHPDATQFAGIRARMRHHIGPLQQLTNFALTTDRAERQGIQKTQEEVRQELALLMSLLMLTIAAAGAHLFLSERRAQRHLSTVIRSRKEAAEARNRLQEAVEAINEGFVLYDSQDRLVLCNTKFRQIYALSADAIVPGARFEDLLRFGVERGQYRGAGPDPEGWISATLARRRQDPEPFEQELGDGRWLIVSDRRTSDGGRVGIRTDITDLKRNVAELTQAHRNLGEQADHMRKLAEAADDANRAKTGFIAMISHEIRTPMNAVLGLAGLLGDTKLENAQKRFVSGIEESGTHLLALINDILDFARFESGNDRAKPVTTAIRELVDGIGRMIGVLAAERGLRFSVAIGNEVPDHLMLDPSYLKQVLINLLGNAVKFTQSGGVTLGVSAVQIEAGSLRLRISVTDTGSGIPVALQERIFEPFERGTTPGAGHGGTGLGLAIARRLAQAMEGSLTLARSDASGTEFILDVPAQSLPATTPAVEVHAPDTTPDAVKGVRPLAILVAEDTPASQLVIRTMLENRGHQVTLVTDGAAALAAAARQDFDLVILDIQMPVMSGDEAATRIRQLVGPRGRVPLAALTAQAFEEDRRRAQAAGFDDHLSKPIRLAELASLLERTADRMPQDRQQATGAIAAGSGEPDHLAELELACGPSTFAMLLRAAIENIELEQQQIMKAESAGDETSIRQSAHRLVALLGQYGSLAALQAAATVENATSGRLAEPLPALHEEIRQALARLRQRQGV